jgi:hypothetical protein
MKKGLCVISPLALFSLIIKAQNAAQTHRSKKIMTNSFKSFLFSARKLTDNNIYHSLNYSGSYGKYTVSTILNP